jgi:hypothetical protein
VQPESTRNPATATSEYRIAFLCAAFSTFVGLSVANIGPGALFRSRVGDSLFGKTARCAAEAQ